jgi:hypothetical protein
LTFLLSLVAVAVENELLAVAVLAGIELELHL